MEALTIADSSGEFSRKAWLLPGHGKPGKVALFLDGEFYVERMNAPALLTDLQARDLIPPMTCLFISHVDATTRHEDYTCSAAFARFLVEDAVPWARKHAGIQSDSGHFIGGASLGGLQAAYTALHHPGVFSSILCQSGSFWWHHEWLSGSLKRPPPAPARFWLSVGSNETASGVTHPPSGLVQKVDQISAVKRFSEALDAQSHHVHYHLYDGGHELASWEKELPEAMTWLLRPSSVVAAAATVAAGG